MLCFLHPSIRFLLIPLSYKYTKNRKLPSSRDETRKKAKKKTKTKNKEKKNKVYYTIYELFLILLLEMFNGKDRKAKGKKTLEKKPRKAKKSRRNLEKKRPLAVHRKILQKYKTRNPSMLHTNQSIQSIPP